MHFLELKLFKEIKRIMYTQQNQVTSTENYQEKHYPVQQQAPIIQQQTPIIQENTAYRWPQMQHFYPTPHKIRFQ